MENRISPFIKLNEKRKKSFSNKRNDQMTASTFFATFKVQKKKKDKKSYTPEDKSVLLAQAGSSIPRYVLLRLL